MAKSEPWPYADLRVVDLSTGIGGPYATKLLVDGGADVIKVEPPAGDPLRTWSASGATIPEGGSGPLFQFLNASKRGIVADLGTSEGREQVLALVQRADLVYENFGPGGLTERGLSLEALQRANPRLSVVSISAFGHDGPWATRPANEWTLQAVSGSTGYRGLPERGPVGAGGRLGEWSTGPYAAIGGAFAWLSAKRTGAGQHVDVSNFETVVSCLTVFHDLQGQFFPGPLPQAIETPSIEPAKDGWVGLCTYTGQQWKDFCALIGRPDLGEDKRFYEGRVRMEHLDTILPIIHAWTREHEIEEIIELMSAMRIPSAPIGDGRRVLEFDHFVARKVFVDNPGGFKQPRPPFLFSRSPLRPIGVAPSLGEHAAEIRAEVAKHSLEPARKASQQGDGEPLPLAGLRVLDFTAFWAGPISTNVLASMGADVIKVESIQRPDGMRFAGAVQNDAMWEWSPVFHGNNTGKRAITLDLSREEGLALVRRLAETADVVCENFSARVMDHFGLGWDALHALNPRLIMLRMPAWGLGGPWRDRVGFAPNVEQASGLAWITGYADMPLIIRGACDPLGGMHAVLAMLMALEARGQSGQGQLVEVPLVEPALNLAAEQSIEYSATGTLLGRLVNRAAHAAPQGCYRCTAPKGERKSEWLAISVDSESAWQGLVRALGSPAWAQKPELATLAGRQQAHDDIDRELGAWCASQVCERAEALLLAEGVPAGACVNAHLLMPNPQLESRRFFETLEHPFTGPTRYPGLPMTFSGLPRPLQRWVAPTLGQHNEEVLREELGLSDAEIEALRDAQVIGTRPSFM